MSNSLRPRESQHTRSPCPSTTPGAHPNSCPSSRWCHPAISSSVVPFSSCPQSLPESESFPMSQLFAWGGQSTGVSVSASVLPMNTQDWSPCSPRDSQESSPTPQFKSSNSSVLSFLHRKVKLSFFTSTIVWLQVSNRQWTHPYPLTENWIKDSMALVLNMALPIRTRPNFPLSQSLPSGSFHKPLILLHHRADRMKTTITEN